jgi:hypothetical protein
MRSGRAHCAQIRPKLIAVQPASGPNTRAGRKTNLAWKQSASANSNAAVARRPQPISLIEEDVIVPAAV